MSSTFFVGGPDWHSLRRSLEVPGFFAWSTTRSETTFIAGCSAARAITQAAPADAGLGLAPNWICCCLFPAHFVELIGHGSWIWLKCASCLQSGLWRAVAVRLGFSGPCSKGAKTDLSGIPKCHCHTLQQLQSICAANQAILQQLSADAMCEPDPAHVQALHKQY